MSFANLPVGWVLAGLAALAGVLLVLQRLRVRHREVTVVTTLFWQEAVQEARARVLTDRFRHPLAYLLVLLIASLAWLAAAEPRVGGDDGRDHVLLLDASAGMGVEGWFDAAREELLADAAWAPRDRTTVILCGATPRTVLLPGESVLLLEKRLEGVAPEPCPETVTRTIRELFHAADDVARLRIGIYGEAFFDAHRWHWAQPVELALPVAPTTPAGPNHGITALGVADAASGTWGAVDVLVEASARPDPVVPRPVATLDGAALEPDTWWTHGGGARFLFRDVPASGGTFTVSLPGGDALAVDDTASRILPARSPIAVAVPEDCPPALLAALRADTAVRLVAPDEPADVHVTRDARVEAPAIVLVRESEQDDAFVVTLDVTDLDVALADAYDELALSQVDATSLANAAGREIRLSARFGDAPQLRVWESLLTDRYDLIGQRAFPAFVARAVRRAAGVTDVASVVAAGEPLPADVTSLREPSGAVIDAGGGVLAPVVAGRHSTADGEPLEVALLDAGATSVLHDRPAAARGDATRAAPPDLAAWAALAALALLCAEWVLLRRGRIP